MKSCLDCRIEKPLTEFHRDGNGGHVPRCKPCRSARRRADPREREANRKYRAAERADPARQSAMLANNFRWRYGITTADRDARLAAQGGVCAICATPDPGVKNWSTDHDRSCCPGNRSCGKCVRGVLCPSCNLALGLMKDDADRLVSAARYVVASRVTASPH